MVKYELTDSQRRFFALVSKAIFLNPFSQERWEIDKQIVSDVGDTQWRQVIPKVVKEVSLHVEKLDAGNFAKIQDFNGEDRVLIEYLFLFDVFHKFMKHFDELIIKQCCKPDTILKVDFAEEATSSLINRGFTVDRAVRYFSVFYQIRRGFHFIDNGLIGQSDAMRQLRCDLWNNIFTHDIAFYEEFLWDKMEDFSTLLLGPTGSGKGAAAAAIGRSGFIPYNAKKGQFTENFMSNFIPINLSQYAETLLESELFGHTKGSFTGAISSHDGLFNMCSPHGAVFLDEIGDISLQVQIKLLQVLQERVFSPVGSHTRLKFHGRVIAATNHSIDELRCEGKFRDDFYYRLCSDTIVMPSLHKRVQENPTELNELISHTVKRIVGEKSPNLDRIVKEVISKKLGTDYHWPGNVRELEQCVRRIIIKRSYIGQPSQTTTDNRIFQTNPTAAELLTQYCQHLYKSHKSYEKVARIANLDRRTVKKYIDI